VNEDKVRNLTEELADLKSRREKAFDMIIRPFDVCISKAERERALLVCPFEVGDILVNFHGERAQVETIEPPTSYNGDQGYNLTGFYVKKDGTPAMNPGRDNTRPRICTFWLYEPWQKEGEE